jgi:hypothetical protein
MKMMTMMKAQGNNMIDRFGIQIGSWFISWPWIGTYAPGRRIWGFVKLSK